MIEIRCCDNMDPTLGLPSIASESVDSLVFDPPAGIGFMGRDWDKDRGGRTEWIAWLTSVMDGAHRVLKPGGHGVVWALPRTSHWTAMACEDARFDVRDVITHHFGSGFPKSHNVAKAIDRKLGEERPVIGQNPNSRPNMVGVKASVLAPRVDAPITASVSDEALAADGIGTALKPGSEHWILIRKQPIGTIAENVMAYGTGGINTDACRVGTSGGTRSAPGAAPNYLNEVYGDGMGGLKIDPDAVLGRWPPNVLLTHAAGCIDDACSPGCPARALDEMSGTLRSGEWPAIRKNIGYKNDGLGNSMGTIGGRRVASAGGASRFFPTFRYEAKAPASEKEIAGEFENTHETVKGVDLMRWLCRLVTPRGGLVLDAFAGSGTTGVACAAERFSFVGFEREEKYAAIARKRIDVATRQQVLAL